MLLSIIVLALAGCVSAGRTFGTAAKQILIPPSTEYELYHYDGSGVLTHMWFGGSWTDWNETMLRVYVDGEEDAGIAMQLYLGHGIGFGDETAPWGTARIGLTSTPSGIYNTYRIPFASQIRITVEMPPAVTTSQQFWWIFRGEEQYPVSFSGMQLPANARLRLYKRSDLLVQPLDFFDLVNVNGTGMLYQVTMAANSTNFSFLEGQVRAYFDNSTEPLFLSSGTEDYFMGSYYFNRGMYHLPDSGLTHYVDEEAVSAYRFHEQDPVYFDQAFRLQLRCGEERNGTVFGPTPPNATSYTTYTWLYQW